MRPNREDDKETLWADLKVGSLLCRESGGRLWFWMIIKEINVDAPNYTYNKWVVLNLATRGTFPTSTEFLVNHYDRAELYE